MLISETSASGIVTFDAWNFIAVTIDFSATTDAIKYYVNGVLMSTGTLGAGPNTVASSGQTVFIGDDFGLSAPFQGSISYLSVHSDIKDSTFILNRYLDGAADDQDN